MRWLVGLVFVAACSGTSTDPVVPAGPLVSVGDVPAPSSTAAPAGASPVEADSAGRSATVVESQPAASVAITVESPRGNADIAGLVADSSDPFGEFVACTGVRRHFGTYSVLGSTTSGPVRSVSAATDIAIDRPGIHAAVIRLEYASGTAVVAAGSMTIDDGFESGEFTGIDAEGTRVDGSYTCSGGPGTEPLAVGADDGVLDAVEVFALLRSGDAERLVGFVVQPGGSASVECAGGRGGESPTVVRVDGDSRVGAISTFELTAGERPTMRFRIGQASFVFDSLDDNPENTPTAGVFSATTDGLTVDGAYRCS